MLNSKFFTVMLVLTLTSAAAVVALQALEMLEYDLFRTLMVRFGMAQ